MTVVKGGSTNRSTATSTGGTRSRTSATFQTTAQIRRARFRFTGVAAAAGSPGGGAVRSSARTGETMSSDGWVMAPLERPFSRRHPPAPSRFLHPLPRPVPVGIVVPGRDDATHIFHRMVFQPIFRMVDRA